MASTTIHTLAYKMVADTRQFTQGILATKSDVAMLKKIMGDTTPEEKAEKAIARLNRLYDNGKISAEQQAKALKQIERELNAVQLAASKSNAVITKMQGLMIKGAKWGAGAAAAGVGILGYNVSKEIVNLKGLADAAEDLQIPFNDLVRLQQAFIRGGEVSGDTVVPALRTMSQNIQLAARDMGKFKALAGELSLDMDSMFALSKMPLLRQFEIIVQQISSMPDQGGKGLIVQKLFGVNENKLTTLLGGGLDKLKEVAATADKFGMTLRDDSVDGVRQLVYQTEALSDKWTGLIRKLVVELTPWLDKTVKAIEAINRFMGDKGTMQTPAAITGPGGRVGAIDPALMFAAKTPAEYAMLRNLSNSARRIDPGFDVRRMSMGSPIGNAPSAQVVRGLQELTSGSFRTGIVAKDEEIMATLITQLTTALRASTEAQQQANEQRENQRARIE